MATIICPACNTANPDGARVCTLCGGLLAGPAVEPATAAVPDTAPASATRSGAVAAVPVTTTPESAGEAMPLTPLQSLRAGKLPLSPQAQKICIAVFAALVLVQGLRVFLSPSDRGDSGGAYTLAVASLKSKLLDPAKATFPADSDSGVTITYSGNDYNVTSYLEATDAAGKASKVPWQAVVHRNVGNGDYTVFKFEIDPSLLAHPVTDRTTPASSAPGTTAAPGTSTAPGASASPGTSTAAATPGAAPAPDTATGPGITNAPAAIAPPAPAIPPAATSAAAPPP